MGTGVGQGFSGATTEVLLSTRERLLRGITRVGEHVKAGTAHVIGTKGGCSPVQGGYITLGLLVRLDEELAHRMNDEG